MPEFDIRPITADDVPAVKDLYATAFHEPNPRLARAGLLEELLPRQGAPRALVAMSRDRVVGMAAFLILEDAPAEAKRLRGFLRAARLARATGRVRPDLLTVAGFELYWESYDNSFVRSAIEPRGRDAYFTALAVAQPLRRLGIGTALARKRMELAREGGATSVYVGCWSGGRSAHLYEKLDFLPVVAWGPAYDDGTAMKIMAHCFPED